MFSRRLLGLSTNEGHAILFAAAIIAGLSILLLLHRLVKKRFVTGSRLFNVFGLIAFAAAGFLFSTRLEGEAQSLAFGLIVGSVLPALYFFLEMRFDQIRAERSAKHVQVGLRFDEVIAEGNAKHIESTHKLETINRSIRDLISPARAARSDRRLHRYIRDKLAEILVYIYDNSKKLNDFVEGPAAKTAFGRIYIDAVFHHAEVAFKQLLENRIFIKYEVFSRTWARLTGESRSYLSVCDLSPYCNIWEPDLELDIDDWKDRLEREINHLKTLQGQKLEKFDKVIVYQKRQFIENPAAPPSCVQNGTCEGNRCRTACIVQSVAEMWLNSGLNGNFFSHAGDLQEPKRANVWLVDRQYFSSLFAKVNEVESLNGHRITSLDIGLFGNDVVGEEFKLQGQTFRYVGGKADLETPSTSERQRSFDYMYIMRSDRSLHTRLESKVVSAMKPGGKIVPCFSA